jgi:acetyl-CoA C-acetyltransferase
MSEVVIASAARTAIGTFGGGLSTLSAAELGEITIREALLRSEMAGEDVDEVILGQVLTAAAGMNPARQAALAAGIPQERTALTINQVCGSGLRAVALAAQAIKTGDSEIVVAGGQESMSQSPHAQNLRLGQKMGDLKLIDTMIKDGLWDHFNGYHMGEHSGKCCETMANHKR